MVTEIPTLQPKLLSQCDLVVKVVSLYKPRHLFVTDHGVCSAVTRVVSFVTKTPKYSSHVGNAVMWEQHQCHHAPQ